jgi:hypothetical protein
MCPANLGHLKGESIMNFKNVAVALTTVVALAAPMAVSAASVSPGDKVGAAFALAPGATRSDSFEPTENVRVNIVSVSGTGFSDGKDLAKFMFGLNAPTMSFSLITNNGATASAEGSIPSFNTASPFSLEFSAGDAEEDLFITYTFTVDAAVVPVPASGLLLASVIAGGAALRRRKRKS